jgi:hypothetical protein
MFTDFGDIEASSANKFRDLAAGIYVEKQEIYVSKAGDIELVVRKFTRDDEQSYCVIDTLQLEKESGEVSFQDFLKLPDGRWRSGNGTISINLLELFPTNFINMQLIDELDEGDVIEVPGAVL